MILRFLMLSWIISTIIIVSSLFYTIVEKTTQENRIIQLKQGFNSTTKNVISIHIYGGSISRGACNGCERYSNVLQEFLIENGIDNAVISNYAIGGSGPEHFIHCGIDYADIIVSEYRMNEQSVEVLEQWYEVATKSSRHLIVLDLWTWLVPPSTPWVFASSKAVDKFTKEDISILQLDGFTDTWRELIPLYYDYESIPQSCYHASMERNGNERNEIQNCRKKYENDMQHGTQLYHYAIARQLSSHIQKVVLPRRHLEATREESSSSNNRVCIGEWGGKHLYSSDWYTSTIIRDNIGFSIGSPLAHRLDKVTLNTNNTNAQLNLECPAPYQTAYVGYIGHALEEESGIMKMNDIIVSTHISDRNLPTSARIRRMSPSVTSPLHISVESLKKGAYIELTNIVCS